MTKRKTPLPDRWDFDQWRMGSPLNPPKGHKVSMYWGEYLTLEHFMRKIAGDLELARKEIEHLADILNKGTTEEDHWRLSPDFSMAQDTVDNVEFVLANIRRTGKWPNPEDEGGQNNGTLLRVATMNPLNQASVHLTTMMRYHFEPV